MCCMSWKFLQQKILIPVGQFRYKHLVKRHEETPAQRKMAALVQWLKDKTGKLTKQDQQAAPLTNMDRGMWTVSSGKRHNTLFLVAPEVFRCNVREFKQGTVWFAYAASWCPLSPGRFETLDEKVYCLGEVVAVFSFLKESLNSVRGSWRVARKEREWEEAERVF